MIWLYPLRISTLLYFLMRYLPAAQMFFQTSVSENTPGCTLGAKITAGLSTVGRGAIIVILLIRTCALFPHSRILWLILGVLGVWSMGVDTRLIPKYDCSMNLDPSRNFSTLFWLNYYSRLVFEVAVTLLTCWKVHATYRVAKQLGTPSGLVGLLYRSGE